MAVPGVEGRYEGRTTRATWDDVAAARIQHAKVNQNNDNEHVKKVQPNSIFTAAHAL